MFYVEQQELFCLYVWACAADRSMKKISRTFYILIVYFKIQFSNVGNKCFERCFPEETIFKFSEIILRNNVVRICSRLAFKCFCEVLVMTCRQYILYTWTFLACLTHTAHRGWATVLECWQILSLTDHYAEIALCNRHCADGTMILHELEKYVAHDFGSTYCKGPEMK